MRWLTSLLVCVTAVAALAVAPASEAATRPDAIFGVWRNPKDTVHIDIRACGTETCGYIVWASDRAKEKARKRGTENLIGLQVLRDFQQTKDGAWRGKVFAPDIGMTFSGAAELVETTKLNAKGCVFGNVLCKVQVWTRIERTAG